MEIGWQICQTQIRISPFQMKMLDGWFEDGASNDTCRACGFVPPRHVRRFVSQERPPLP